MNVEVQHLRELAVAELGPTIVEVTMRGCSACRKLEAQFPAFQEIRPEVSFVRVHHPNKVSSEQEFDQMEAQRARFSICSTPHIVVVSSEGLILAEDDCKSKRGRAYLNRWMEKEAI